MLRMLKMVSGAHLMMKQKTDGEFLVLSNNIPLGVVQFYDVVVIKYTGDDPFPIRISGTILGDE